MPRVTDTKILEKVEKSTLLFLKRGAFCYYSGIDWLTVRFPQTSALYSVLWGLTDNSAVYTFPFGGFKVIYRGIL